MERARDMVEKLTAFMEQDNTNFDARVVAAAKWVRLTPVNPASWKQGEMLFSRGDGKIVRVLQDNNGITFTVDGQEVKTLPSNSDLTDYRVWDTALTGAM